MASHLERIFGTEEDKVNCPFYFKIGACRHGDKCSRIHNRPLVCTIIYLLQIAQTIMIPHMYLNPIAAPMIDAEGRPVEYDKKYLRDHFEEFYEDIFEELSKHGEVEDLQVADNVCEHLLGNVYVRYRSDDEAEKALKTLQGRYYAGRLLLPEFSPVSDFRDSRCRQYDEDQCTRGGLCNFMHLKRISRSLKKELFREQRKQLKRSRRERDSDDDERREKKKRRDRSGSRERKHRRRSGSR